MFVEWHVFYFRIYFQAKTAHSSRIQPPRTRLIIIARPCYPGAISLANEHECRLIRPICVRVCVCRERVIRICLIPRQLKGSLVLEIIIIERSGVIRNDNVNRLGVAVFLCGAENRRPSARRMIIWRILKKCFSTKYLMFFFGRDKKKCLFCGGEVNSFFY